MTLAHIVQEGISMRVNSRIAMPKTVVIVLVRDGSTDIFLCIVIIIASITFHTALTYKYH